MAKQRKIKASSGNVFADMGYDCPEDSLAKAIIAGRISDVIKAKRLTQVAAAKLLEIDQPRVSDLSCGRVRRFSLDTLLQFLILLGQDVEIRIKQKSKSGKEAEIRVLAA